MTRIKLSAKPRVELGRKAKKLRREGLIPANVFGKKISSFAVSVNAKEFSNVFSKAGETSLIDLSLGEKTHPVLVAEVQIDPVSGQSLHIDFHEVDLTEKVHATVPVELVGEAEAVKSGLGTLVQLIDEVEVEALPTDLPERFELDITNLSEVDAALFVKDIKYDESKVTIETDKELIITKIEEPQKEEIAPAVETPAEAEVIGEEAATDKPAEGETPKSE